MEPETASSGGDVASGLEPAVKAAAEARLALLLKSYGEAFAGDGGAIARAAIEGAVARDWKLRNLPLANADEAAVSFIPYRAAEPQATR